MGQYFIMANLDKKEYISPHDAGHGGKLWEIAVNNLGSVLIFLLRKSSEGGGGDIQFESKHAGRWAGDKIAVIGDYDESKMYQEAKDSWKEISKEIASEVNQFVESDIIKVDKKLIAEGVYQLNETEFDVVSSSGDKQYRVKNNDGAWNCSCPANKFRNNPNGCKHIAKVILSINGGADNGQEVNNEGL